MHIYQIIEQYFCIFPKGYKEQSIQDTYSRVTYFIPRLYAVSKLALINACAVKYSIPTDWPMFIYGSSLNRN